MLVHYTGNVLSASRVSGDDQICSSTELWKMKDDMKKCCGVSKSQYRKFDSIEFIHFNVRVWKGCQKVGETESLQRSV
ncbi:predicted protein [Sclerotinia sclerotiorum 1980 UF-70]|uniref:Uncharacterized protein n=1 Tax=Sclerotinia sclerotiorum (strain ATCC 18683 / 1980 / Ss-1) TaxID=665079 RepID=A7F9Z9_SCLS1|nr:predicted protein [Sclerotinia sclerotiorum 1980 UF-70]EDO00560.1 predicted protein [Sclerotinia sclerotiorum 1980 UF-70]